MFEGDYYYSLTSFKKARTEQGCVIWNKEFKLELNELLNYTKSRNKKESNIEHRRNPITISKINPFLFPKST